jgi:hypothetical protein
MYYFVINSHYLCVNFSPYFFIIISFDFLCSMRSLFFLFFYFISDYFISLLNFTRFDSHTFLIYFFNFIIKFYFMIYLCFLP